MIASAALRLGLRRSAVRLFLVVAAGVVTQMQLISCKNHWLGFVGTDFVFGGDHPCNRRALGRDLVRLVTAWLVLDLGARRWLLRLGRIGLGALFLGLALGFLGDHALGFLGSAALDVLAERGTATGVASYLQELKERLIPLF